MCSQFYKNKKKCEMEHDANIISVTAFPDFPSTETFQFIRHRVDPSKLLLRVQLTLRDCCKLVVSNLRSLHVHGQHLSNNNRRPSDERHTITTTAQDKARSGCYITHDTAKQLESATITQHANSSAL